MNANAALHMTFGNCFSRIGEFLRDTFCGAARQRKELRALQDELHRVRLENIDLVNQRSVWAMQMSEMAAQIEHMNWVLYEADHKESEDAERISTLYEENSALRREIQCLSSHKETPSC